MAPHVFFFFFVFVFFFSLLGSGRCWPSAYRLDWRVRRPKDRFCPVTVMGATDDAPTHPCPLRLATTSMGRIPSARSERVEIAWRGNPICRLRFAGLRRRSAEEIGRASGYNGCWPQNVRMARAIGTPIKVPNTPRETSKRRIENEHDEGEMASRVPDPGAGRSLPPRTG